jgi:hypothetical protein
LGERSVETLVSGLRELTDATETLPAGFDPGVLKALLPFRTSIKRGIVDIAFAITGQDAPNESHLNAEKVDVAARLIERPIRAHGSASGTLEMVDFKSLQCRIDRPPLPSVLCTFDEKERDTVQAAVRQFVHVEGEAEFDPGSTEPSRIWVASIDVLYEALPFDPQSFWQVSRNADLVAHARAPIAGEEEDDGWRDDEEAARLIDAIRQSG